MGGGLHAIGTLVVAFLVLFSKNLLNLKEKAPLTNKAFEYFAVLFFACGMAISLGVPYVNLFFNIASSIFFTLLLVTAIRAWRNRYFANARFYLIALMIYMPSMGVMTLTYNAVLPNTDFFRYAFLPGSLVEILFFSFVLISRYHYANKEKIFMQNELMREKDRYSSDLEAKVEERTRELARINQQLMRQTEELNETKKQLTIDAATDVLSGLYNRRYFLERFTSLFADAKSLKYAISVVMIDVDHFKSINDRHGHQVGDDAIKACADILKEYARNTDVVARYGGEEFTILMPHSTLDDALLLAERIRSQVERQSINIDDKVILRLTLSIGVTQIDLAQDESVDDILQRVDRALYEAKDGGRNKVVGL